MASLRPIATTDSDSKKLPMSNEHYGAAACTTWIKCRVAFIRS